MLVKVTYQDIIGTCFPITSAKGNNFRNFLFATLHDDTLPKGGFLKKERGGAIAAGFRACGQTHLFVYDIMSMKIY